MSFLTQFVFSIDPLHRPGFLKAPTVHNNIARDNTLSNKSPPKQEALKGRYVIPIAYELQITKYYAHKADKFFKKIKKLRDFFLALLAICGNIDV